MDKYLNTENTNIDAVDTFFSDPENTPNAQKPKSQARARAGERKENIHIKKLEDNGANVETIVKSPSKAYKKLSVSAYDDDGETKKERKKRVNRNIRRTEGVLPAGSAYKKGSEVINYDDDSEE